MVSKRKGQKQIWADPEFVGWLKKLKAKKQLDGEEIANIGELTRQMVNTKAIEDVEKQMLKDQNLTSIKIKLDARRIFG